MKIYLGSDHAGYELKEKIEVFLKSKKIQTFDLGNLDYDPADDYPDYSYEVAKNVAKNRGSLGILLCGSSQGACITANKVKGIRAAAAKTVAEATLAKEHDDVNVLCLAGGKQVQKKYKNIGVSLADAKKIINAWLGAKFSSETRHRRRINKIKKIEQKNFK